MAVPQINRRELLSSMLTTTIISTEESSSMRIDDSEITKMNKPWTLTIPLEPSSGGTNSIRATLSYRPVTSLFGTKTYIPKKIYKLIVDTGSPYLVVANGMEYATFFEELNTPDAEGILFQFLEFISLLLVGDFPYILSDSSYGPTEDIYGSKKGNIEWKESFVEFRDSRLSKNTVFGVLDETLTSEAGGPLLGLVKRSNVNTDKVDLRPTFFDQTSTEYPISSFQIDCPNQSFTIASGKSLIFSDGIRRDRRSIIPLIDLRPLGDFVEHYACKVNELQLNGTTFTPKKLTSIKDDDDIVREIVAVFDSGLTGCLLTQPLWDALQAEGMNLDDINTINVGVMTEQSSDDKTKGKADTNHDLYHFQTDASKNPYYNLMPISLDWFENEDTCPYVVVLGQTFLAQGCLTIDIDDRKATFDV
jgi:hypothetical protein